MAVMGAVGAKNRLVRVFLLWPLILKPNHVYLTLLDPSNSDHTIGTAQKFKNYTTTNLPFAFIISTVETLSARKTHTKKKSESQEIWRHSPVQIFM